MRVYLIDKIPGVALTTPWEQAVKTNEPFVYVLHHPARRRAFAVHIHKPNRMAPFDWSSHFTLDAAIKAANLAAKVQQ